MISSDDIACYTQCTNSVMPVYIAITPRHQHHPSRRAAGWILGASNISPDDKLSHLHAHKERCWRALRRDNCLRLAVGSTFKRYIQTFGRKRGFIQLRRALNAQGLRKSCRRTYFRPGDVNDKVKSPCCCARRRDGFDHDILTRKRHSLCHQFRRVKRVRQPCVGRILHHSMR